MYIQYICVYTVKRLHLKIWQKNNKKNKKKNKKKKEKKNNFTLFYKAFYFVYDYPDPIHKRSGYNPFSLNLLI